MTTYLLRRVLLFVPTFFLASAAVFIAMRVLPGDVATVILGNPEAGGVATPQQFDELRRQLGLKDPLPVQYGRWVWSMVNGELGGRSIMDQEPLPAIVGRRGLVTLQLAFYALVISLIVSVPLGVLAAVYQDRWPDYIVRMATIAGQAVPHFWVALLALLFLTEFFSWTPPLRYQALWEDPWLHAQKVVWPALILAWGFSSNLARVTRSSMLEVLRQDYVRTARSKGLTENIVLWRHALRNALITVVTVAGLNVAALLSGTVILESIFGLPGMGQGIVKAALARDFPVVQSLAMLLVVAMMGVNLIIDVLYAWIDPRISYS